MIFSRMVETSYGGFKDIEEFPLWKFHIGRNISFGPGYYQFELLWAPDEKVKEGQLLYKHGFKFSMQMPQFWFHRF